MVCRLASLRSLLLRGYLAYATQYTGEGFPDALDLSDVTLAGVSIGGSMSYIIAGRSKSQVRRVVAINPYDYAKGRGVARSSREA